MLATKKNKLSFGKIIPFCLFVLIHIAAHSQNADSLLSSLKNNGDTTTLLAIIKKANNLSRERPDSAIQILNKITSSVLKIKNERIVGKFYNNKGKILNNQGKYDEAIIQLDSALYFYRKINFASGVASVVHNKGISHVKKGKLPEGLKFLIEAEEKYLAQGNKKDAISAQQGQGTVFLKMNNIEKAIQIFKKAEQTAIDLKDSVTLMYIRLNIGSIYNQTNDFEPAVNYYKQVLIEAQKRKESYVIIAAASNLGTIYFEQKKFKEAIEVENMALQLAEKTNDIATQASVLSNLASAYASKSDYITASEKIDKCLSLLDITKSLGERVSATKTKSEILFSMGKQKEAYEWLLKHLSIKDSLMSSEQQQTTAELHAKYEDVKKEQQINELNTQKIIGEKELKLSEQKNKIYVLVAVAIGLTLLTFIVAFINNRKKSRLLAFKNEQIEENLKEKEMLLMEVHHRVKNNLQMIYSILNMQSKNLPQDVADILNENKDRIRSISIIHEKLYQNEDILNINLKELIADIAANAKKSSPFSNYTNISVNCDNFKPDMDTMISLGIMINELVTNCFKYAFTNDKDNKIDISLFKNEANNLVLTIADNGKGFPESFSIDNPSSFGYKMIKTLCKKVKGEIICKNNNGATVIITMSKYKLAA
ncbi:MAG: tetratricopeptide repeat protein [Bacteroidota bacterium]|nr:tetratricopeptide repeat protein [Bacteroidota bacterium]